MTTKDVLCQDKDIFINNYNTEEWCDLREDIKDICSKYSSWLKRVEFLKAKIEEEKKQVSITLTYKECGWLVNVLECAKTNFDNEKIRTIIGKIQSSDDYQGHYHGT